MTNSYLIHAWCVRPFIAYLDPVEASTPEEAIAIARRQPETLLNAAEDCNDDYLWEEFAAYDESGTELLRVVDEPARLRNAAPALLAACTAALTRIADFYRDTFDSRMDNDPLVVQLRQALAQAGAATLPPPQPAERPIVAVSVRDGIVDVDASIPVIVVVEDWDVTDEDTGERPTRSVYGLAGDLPTPKVEKLRRLIANH